MASSGRIYHAPSACWRAGLLTDEAVATTGR